jgi:hypothetical protein
LIHLLRSPPRSFSKGTIGWRPASVRHLLPFLRSATVDARFSVLLSRLRSCQILNDPMLGDFFF